MTTDDTRDLVARIDAALAERKETDADRFNALTVAQNALGRWRQKMAQVREALIGEVYLYDMLRALIGTVQALRETDDALLRDARDEIVALRAAGLEYGQGYVTICGTRVSVEEDPALPPGTIGLRSAGETTWLTGIDAAQIVTPPEPPSRETGGVPLRLEIDADDTYILSDPLTLQYGAGATPRIAFDEWLASLDEYAALLKQEGQPDIVAEFWRRARETGADGATDETRA